MASNVTDDARRAEILRRALMGLNEDIDDLRAELLDALPDYEQRLRKCTSRLPDWLKLAPATIRQQFHFHEDSPAGEGILGPRAVALGAGRVEAFVERWFDLDEEPGSLSDEAGQALVDDYEALCSYLDALEDQTRQVARSAKRTLEEWLDAVLGQLDARRETDVEAIEALVREGEIGRGRNARQEIADLWEEQRHQADEIQARWAPILALADEGSQVSLSGLGELWEMVGRAYQGLVGAYPKLEDRLEAPEHLVGASEDQPREEKDEEEEKEEDVLENEEDVLEVDEPAGATVPDEASPTAIEVDQPSDTVPDGFVHGIVPLEEPTSEPEMATLESSSVSDYSEPHLAEPSSASSTTTPTQRLYTRSDPEADAGDTAPPSRPEAPAPDETSEAGSRKKSSRKTRQAKSKEDEPAKEVDPIVSRCFRIRAGYEPVGGAEIAAVLAPPVLFLLAMAALCARYLTGAEGAFNPLERWSWAPASLAVGFAWLLLVPLVLHWRTRWSGFRLRILRSTDVRQDEELVIGDHTLQIGPASWRFAELDAPRLRRWDSPADEICGWALVIEPPSHSLVYLVAPEADRRKWQNSPSQLVDVPYEAWQLGADDFAALRDRLL